MVTPVAERAVPDANILLAATNEADRGDARQCLNEWPSGDDDALGFAVAGELGEIGMVWQP